MPGMRRREFVSLFGGAAASSPAWSRVAHAQQRTPTIGFLGVSTAASWTDWTAAFVSRLGELGWTDGRNVAIEYRWAGGLAERYPEIAAEFVRRKVDIIVTGGIAVPAAKQATSTIPIVFALAADPLAGSLVTSLARPGGNVTGLSAQSSGTASKRVRNSTRDHSQPAPDRGDRECRLCRVRGRDREVQAVASRLGLQVDRLEIHRADDIAPAFERLKTGAQALYVCTDALANANCVRINILALGARLPTMHGLREYVDPAGLMSYGPSISDLFRRTAEYVDKILRGAKPGDIPVEQPTKFELVINLTVAKALGLEAPPTLLARADEVIE